MLRWSAAALLLLALTTLALAGLLAAARAWRVDVGAPGDAYSIAGAYPAEQGGGVSLRWTRGTATLRTPGASPGTAALALRLFHQSPAAQPGAPWALTLAAPGAPPARFVAAPGWRVYRILLPPGASSESLRLTSPTFQPGSGDPRSLGVAVDWLAVRPLNPSWPLALARAAYLAALAGLAAASGWLLDRWAFGAAHAAGRPWRALALLAGIALALIAWLWYDPLSQAWMLPTRWLGLALAALATGGAVGWAQLTRRRPATDDRRLRITQGLRLSPRPGAVAGRWSVAVVVALAHPLALAPIVPAGWRGLAAWVILGAPGALAALAIFAGERDPLERTLLAIAGALAVAAPLVLALHAIPGPLEAWQLALAADLLSLLGLLGPRPPAPIPQPPPPGPQPTALGPRLLIPALVIAAALRLTLLGAAEFQGDEAYVMMLARGIRYGQPDILFVHMKGPVEALIPAGPLVITGVTSEWIARLPFAVAGLALLLGVYLLARRMLGAPAGPRAGAMAAAALARPWPPCSPPAAWPPPSPRSCLASATTAASRCWRSPRRSSRWPWPRACRTGCARS